MKKLNNYQKHKERNLKYEKEWRKTHAYLGMDKSILRALKKLKICAGESYSDVIKRLIEKHK